MEGLHRKRIVALTMVLVASLWPANAQTTADVANAGKQDLRTFIPDSISPQARAIFEKMLPPAIFIQDSFKKPETIADFDALYQSNVKGSVASAAALAKALGVTSADLNLGGVGVLETKPANYHDDGTVLIRVHGGGFFLGSARSSAGGDAQMAAATGKRILSVDYTVAPRGRWPLVTDQVIAVYKAVLAEGYKPGSIGMSGDSAGANIVPASILKMRDQGIPMPGAVVLFSAFVDFNANGDTETTLGKADPALTVPNIMPGLKAYADPADWRNPYVSPIYGDFKKGFPPVLLQVGTKEMLLSDSVRLYQALKMAGNQAELDVYEGMTHVFQSYMMNTPEQKQAYAEIVRFWSGHLQPTKR